jgi:hypothetical protein
MKTWLQIAALSTIAIGLAACGGKPQPAPSPEPPKPEVTAPAPAPAPVSMPRSPSPAGAKVTITSPANGATVKSPVTVKFAIAGMTLAPSGTNEPNTGHHHLLIDTDLPPLDQPMPRDAGHLHFGQGQTEAQVELAPGRHTLQLLLGDGNHVPHDPPVMSEKITITVE